MAYSKIERHMWSDDKFRRFPRDVRDMWQYLLSSEHCNRFGLFVLDPLYAAADLSAPDDRWSEARVLAAWDTLGKAGRISVDFNARLVLVHNHFKHNHPENPNVVKGALTELEALPFSESLWPLFLEAMHTHCRLDTEKGEPFVQQWVDATIERITKESAEGSGKGMGKGSPNHMPNPEPEPEPEQEELQDAKASSSGSAEPNADSVKEVFQHWQRTSGHNRAKLLPERRKKIKARLKQFTVQELCEAVDGACSNPFFAGDNERGQNYDYPETIFKSDAATERHIEYARSGGPPSGPGGKTLETEFAFERRLRVVEDEPRTGTDD